MLETFKKELTYCAFCPKMCHFSCSVAIGERKESVTPTGKLTAFSLFERGLLKEGKEVGALAYKCTTCKACYEQCLHGIEVPPVCLSMRGFAVDEGLEPQEVKDWAQKLLNRDNPYRRGLLNRARELFPKEYINRKAEVLLFPGCTYLYYHPQVLRASIEVLEKAGVDFALYAQRSLCCGAPPYYLGLKEIFRKWASDKSEAFSSYKTLVTGCPGCAHFFKEVYPKEGLGPLPEVLTMAQFLHQLFGQGLLPIKTPTPLKVMYHDPCYLGRYLGVYEEPRALLAQATTGGEVEEFQWSRQNALCCGGGGGLRLTSPSTARGLAQRRWKEFKEKGADVLVSACPFCLYMLKEADGGAQVLDLVEVVAKGLL